MTKDCASLIQAMKYATSRGHVPLTVLRALDGERKGTVLRFLAESGLIGTLQDNEAIVSLKKADLTGAKLWAADLRGADLEEVGLAQAFLEVARLEKANLDGTNLSMADLCGANLTGASLIGADLSKAALLCTTLRNACLYHADMRGANLGGAVLEEADLSGADLSNARLDRADLRRAKLSEDFENEPALDDPELVELDRDMKKMQEGFLQGADMTRANLRGAQVTIRTLAQAKSLKGAIMSDGTVHD